MSGLVKELFTQKKDFIKIIFWLQLLKNCDGDKKIMKTKKNCYFNRYGCSLYRSKA